VRGWRQCREDQRRTRLDSTSQNPKAYPLRHRSLRDAEAVGAEVRAAEAARELRATDIEPRRHRGRKRPPCRVRQRATGTGSEKASAAATVLVIFKDVRTVDSDKNMSPSISCCLARPPWHGNRSVVARMSPRWPSSHQGRQARTTLV